MAPNNVGTENSINHLLPYPGGYLASTDGGLYRYSPENPHNSFVPEGGYRRSVRQVYSLGEREYFVATQDGLKFYDGASFFPLGKNTEIDSFAGSLNHEVVGTAELEVFIADQEGVRFIPCRDVIKSVVLSFDSIYVATSSGIGIVIGDALEPLLERKVNDMVSVRDRLVFCGDDGVYSILMNGRPSNPTQHLNGSYSDLQLYSGGLLAVGSKGLTLMSHELQGESTTGASGVTKCYGVREEAGRSAFSLDQGIFVSSPDDHKFKFIKVRGGVRDLLFEEDHLLVASQDGVRAISPSAWKWAWAGGALLLLLVPLWLWWGKMRRTVVFISYRRSDSSAMTGWLHDRLLREFGKRSVRMDLHSFEGGKDFRDQIRRIVEDAHVVLAIVGPEWDGGPGTVGVSRLFDPIDYVRFELELAHDLKKEILPIMIEGSRFPSVLPESLTWLSFRHSLELKSDAHFDEDAEKIIDTVKVCLARAKQQKKIRVKS